MESYPCFGCVVQVTNTLRIIWWLMSSALWITRTVFLSAVNKWVIRSWVYSVQQGLVAPFPAGRTCTHTSRPHAIACFLYKILNPKLKIKFNLQFLCRSSLSLFLSRSIIYAWIMKLHIWNLTRFILDLKCTWVCCNQFLEPDQILIRSQMHMLSLQ